MKLIFKTNCTAPWRQPSRVVVGLWPRSFHLALGSAHDPGGRLGLRMRALSLVAPHLHLPAEPHSHCPRPPNYSLLREWHSNFITSNYCLYCCLERRSNRSAAERSPKQVNLGQLDTVSSLKSHAAHFRSQRQPPRGSQRPWYYPAGCGVLSEFKSDKRMAPKNARHRRVMTSGKVTRNDLYPQLSLAASTLAFLGVSPGRYIQR